MPFVELKNLVKHFGHTIAVDGLSLSIEQGEIFGLLGPNGAGKSTALNLLSGLLTPDAGKALVDGISATERPLQVKQMLGVVPQEVSLYPRLSARANLKFWGEVYGLRGKALAERIDEILEMVGLSNRAGDRLAKYSGGMKRRVNIAAGILHRPSLLILDEPTVGVDPQSRNHIFDIVRSLRDAGTTVVYTSHYMDEVELLCDRVGIMDRGNLIALGTVSDLLKQAAEHQEVEIGGPRISEELLGRLRAIPVVSKVRGGEGGIHLTTDDAEKALALAFGCLVGAGQKVSRIEIHKPSLEGLFIKLTGRSLRD